MKNGCCSGFEKLLTGMYVYAPVSEVESLRTLFRVLMV